MWCVCVCVSVCVYKTCALRGSYCPQGVPVCLYLGCTEGQLLPYVSVFGALRGSYHPQGVPVCL